MLLKAAMLFNFSSSEYLSHHRTRKNRVSPVNRASTAHMYGGLSLSFKISEKKHIQIKANLK